VVDEEQKKIVAQPSEDAVGHRARAALEFHTTPPIGCHCQNSSNAALDAST
jgi:hypothetical protein